MANGVHEQRLNHNAEEHKEIKASVKELYENSRLLQVQVAKQTVHIEHMHEKIDDVGLDIKDLKTSITADIKKQNSQLKKWAIRMALFILGSGSIAGGAQFLGTLFGGE